MADINRDVNVTISAIDAFSSNMQTFGNQWGTIAGILTGVEVAILGASTAAAAFGVKLGTDVFQSAVDFHDAIYDVKAVAGDFGASQQEIGKILDDLALKFPLTGAEAGKALEMIAQKGYNSAEQLTKMSEAAAVLNLAVGEDMTRSAQGMIATMNAFGLSIAETDRVMNLWVATSFASSMNVADLNESMKFAAPMASQLGYSVETTAAALAILRDKGLDAAMAGTTFRQALANLMRETPQAGVALAELGLNFADVSPKTKSLVEIIGAFEGKVLTADQAMRIFGIRQGTMALLVEDGTQKFLDMEAKITGTTAAFDAMNAKLEKWSVVMAQVGGSMDYFKNTIGNEIVPYLTKMIGTTEYQGVRGVITALTELEIKEKGFGSVMMSTIQQFTTLIKEAFENQFGSAESMYTYLVNIADLLGTNIVVLGSWLSELAKVFVDATDSQDDLKTALQVLNVAIFALAAPIALIHDIFVGLWYAIELGIDAVQYAWNAFGANMTLMTLNMAKALGSLPFVDMTDNIKNLEAQMKTFETGMDGAFNSKAPELWGDNVFAAAKKANDAINNFGTESRTALSMVSVKWSDVAVSATLTSDGFKDASYSTAEFKSRADDAAGSLPAIVTEVDKIAAKFKLSTEQTTEFMNKVAESTASGKSLNDAVKEVTTSMGLSKTSAEGVATATGQASISIRTAADGTIVLEQNMTKAADAATSTKTKLDAVANFEMKIELAQFEAGLKMAETQVKNAHELALANLEWKAKLDIAEVQANAEKVKAAFDSISKSVAATASATASMFGALAGAKDLTGSLYFDLTSALAKQLQIQRDLADAQIKLTDAQTEEILARNRAMSSGQAVYNINVAITGDTAGWMNGLMSEMLKQIIVKANAEAFNCLCKG